jgi:truncated hemoglobin YjbI
MIDVRLSRVSDEPRRDDPSASDFVRLGEAGGLRAIIDDFMDRVFGDVMIGFLFEGKPKARIRELEYRLAAEHLGGDVRYDGRPLDEAHRALKVMDGHFARRLHLLRETLAAHRVPDDVAARWLAHDEAQRPLVLAGSCR